MKNLLIIVCIIFAFSCKEEKPVSILKEDTSEVVINGTIKNYSLEDSIFSTRVFGYDKLLNQIGFDVPIDSNGKFKARFNLDYQQDINLYYKNWLTLLLSPGDSVSISFDGAHKTKTDLYQSIEISGTATKINKNLFAFKKGDTTLNAYNQKISKLEPEAYSLYHDSIFRKREEYINDYLKNNPNIDKSLESWLYVERELEPKTRLLGFPMYYRMYNPKKGQQVDYGQAFFKPLKSIATFSDEHIVNGNIASFGNYYLFHYYQQIRPPGVTMKANAMDSIALRRIINDNKDNKFIAQLAIGNRLKSNLESQNIDFFENEKELITELFSGSIFEEPLFNSYNTVKARIEKQELPEGAETLEFTSKNSKDYLSEIIENASGKVIYIDHWATWCAPCLSQFKNHTTQFKKRYEDKVEFVYLCYESEQPQWKPIISKYNLTGKHYFITEKDGIALAEQMRVDGFPTYTIIDKNGEIVQSDFKYRPSEAVTRILIDDLLEERGK